MKSGRETLRDIHRALDEERARLADVDRRTQAASDGLVAIDGARSETLAELARLRVSALADRTATDLRRGEQRAADVLAARHDERAAVDAELQELEAAAERLRSEREAAADTVEAASDALDAAEAETQARLEGDDAYRAKRHRARELERTARHAQEKAAESEEERAVKGRAFERDPIFSYLWRRGYGTSAYRAGPLTRWLDRVVARLVSFEANRANYARLVALPVRLREHAETVAAAAEAEFEALRQRDEAARADDGVDALERERDEAEAELARIDDAIKETEAARSQALERRERMDRGEDDAYAEAVSVLAADLQREDVQALRRQALATPQPEDDALVAQLRELEAERAALETTLKDLKGVAAGNRERVRELERLRRDFTDARFDAPDAAYPDGDLVSTVLSQFLRGTATRAVLWRVLEGQRRSTPRRSDPRFGSGGFGKGTPWGGAGSWRDSGKGIGRAFGGGSRRSGGMPSGGFRTGGRMRGGGFGTGGKRRT